MAGKFLFLLGLFFISVNAIAAQNRVITNEDLEKYRQKRLAAERDLRENYERLGFPSPEEMQKQEEKSRAERSELSARLEAEKIRRERQDIERQRIENEARLNNQQYQTPNYQNNYSPNLGYSNFGYGGFLSFPNYGNGFYNRGYRGGFYNNQRGNFNNQPRVEYRNNLPVIVPPQPPRILAPR